MSSPLVNEAHYWAEQMGSEIVARAQQRDPTGGKIAPNISYKIDSVTEERVSLSIGVDVSPGKGSPFAAAFEYGSGIRSTKSSTSPQQEGSRGYIIIRPKKSPWLVFEGTNAWKGQVIVVPPLGGGVVHHPGIEAQPYLKPSIEAVRIKFKRMMAKGLMDSIKMTIKKEFYSGAEMIG